MRAQQPMATLRPSRQPSRRRRTSWAEPGKEIRVEGAVIQVNKRLHNQVIWGHRCMAFGMVFGSACWILNSSTFDISSPVLLPATYVSFLIGIFGFGMVLRSNVSLTILKRLLKELNVTLCLFLALLNLGILASDKKASSFMNGLMFFVATCMAVTVDAIIIRARSFVMVCSSFFVCLCFWNIYKKSSSDNDAGNILIAYGEDGTYVIRRNSLQRSIFIEILCLTLEGLKTMIVDEKGELFMYCTGNVYVDAEESKAPIATLPTGKDSVGQVTMLSEIVVLDNEKALRRTRRSRTGFAVCSGCTFTSWVLSHALTTPALLVLTYVFAAGSALCGGMIFYKNVVCAIVCRLLKEVNVLLILTATICNFCIDLVMPTHPSTRINSTIYSVLALLFVFSDGLKNKSRATTLTIGFFFLLMTFYNLVWTIAGGDDIGIILFQYSKLIVYKRATKRSLFIQILMFSLRGMHIAFVDRKMEFLVFGTGNIYRETGTSSLHHEDKSFHDAIEASFKNTHDRKAKAAAKMVSLTKTRMREMV
eukprot:Stramenopile-MAST_4_protein_3047